MSTPTPISPDVAAAVDLVARALQSVIARLDALAPPAPVDADPSSGEAFVWATGALRAVTLAPAPPLAHLLGIDAQKRALVENSRRVAGGVPAHDVLLWGARGMGKSALVRAAVAAVCAEGADLALVALPAQAMHTLPALFARLQSTPRPFILFADDIAFEGDDPGYRALRSVLEGGVEARPDNCRLYVTSTRRHLVARDLGENDPVNPRDVADDRLALADRFGLSLGFHAADQATYLAIVAAYAQAHALSYDEADALAWAAGRGARSGRVAWQYTQEIAGRAGVRLG